MGTRALNHEASFVCADWRWKQNELETNGIDVSKKAKDLKSFARARLSNGIEARRLLQVDAKQSGELRSHLQDENHSQ